MSSCSICLETYRVVHKQPLRVTCCNLPICIECIHGIVGNTSRCPWCQLRWTARSFLKRCEANTPKNYLQELNNQPTDAIIQLKVHDLGDGTLRAEFDSAQEVYRKKRHEVQEQEKTDEEVARQLLVGEKNDYKTIHTSRSTIQQRQGSIKKFIHVPSSHSNVEYLKDKKKSEGSQSSTSMKSPCTPSRKSMRLSEDHHIDAWNCIKCTFTNLYLPQCEICGTTRSSTSMKKSLLMRTSKRL
jgi:hypothetical protein